LPESNAIDRAVRNLAFVNSFDINFDVNSDMKIMGCAAVCGISYRTAAAENFPALPPLAV
jgi:hypothetical protein